ncbi:MAG: DUF4214 domain-containing protein, partial [Lachnospiraceae bacterium]|nr:DUF4214 domain-containing protein [Lachnospiraceae bacterium]
LYRVCLSREPDEDGLNDWVSQLKSGSITGALCARKFIFSREFKSRNYCNECYVKLLYIAFMGREYDEGGLEHWTGKLATGWKRQQVFNGFTQSQEFKSLCEDYGIVRGVKVNIPEIENAYQQDVCPSCGAPAPFKYAIKYVLNNGTQNRKNRTWYLTESATFELLAPTRTGYTFAGWYSDKTFTNKVTSVENGSTGNKTFYAKWTANTYTVKFAKNGGTGTMADLKCTYDAPKALTANAFKRTGYTFNGWNTRADGSGIAYKDKTSVKDLSSKNGGTVTLYAQWKKN